MNKGGKTTFLIGCNEVVHTTPENVTSIYLCDQLIDLGQDLAHSESIRKE